MTTAVHALATKTAIRRLVPLMVAAYFMAFVDRTNVGLAKTQLEADVGISAAAYGFGAGIFFLTYALLEIPSNLILHKVGPRRWIARIAITWGVLSSAMMLTTNEVTFYVLRALLGAAEAGLYPGLMYVVTMWFAQSDRAKVVGYLLVASSAAYVLGNPIGGALMGLDGTLGMHGWQWLFLLEGIPTVAIGVIVLFKLPDTPHDARWLNREQADALVAEASKPATEQIKGGIGAGFRNPVILLIAFIYFFNQVVTYGTIFFVPAVVEAMGVSGSFTIGMLAGAIGFGSIAGVLVFPRLLRRFGRELPLIAFSAIGLVIVPAVFLLSGSPVVQYAMLMCGSFLFTGVLPMFWSVAMARVSGRMAAAVLAFMNTIGLTGGFVGPYLFGIAEGITGRASAGMVVVLLSGALSVLLVLPLTGLLRRERAAAEVPSPRAEADAPHSVRTEAVAAPDET